MQKYTCIRNDLSVVLDDGQVLKGTLGELTQRELISLANQLYREKQEAKARDVMRYQHRKFYQEQPFPPEAA